MASLLAHPIRREILKALAVREPAAPVEMLDFCSPGVSLQLLSYHVSVLREKGCIEATGTEKRRGATATFYARTETTKHGMEGSEDS